MQTLQVPPTATRPVNQTVLDELGERIAADPNARFAISLDHLTYAKDCHLLGFDLARIHVRKISDAEDPGPISGDAVRLLGGLRALTGRTRILGRRYGELAVEARDAGGSLFDFQDDGLARETVLAVIASDEELAMKVRERAPLAQQTLSGVPHT